MSPPVGTAAEPAEYARRGLETAAESGWRSFDPFDALACPLGEVVRRRSRLGARVMVQAGLRVGPAPRMALGIRPRREAKALADLLATAVLAGEDAGPLADLLLDEAVTTPHGRGWGLSFPYASRFVAVEARTPNAYTTASAASALLDAARAFGREDLAAIACEGLRFVTEDLGWIRRREGDYVRYWPGSDVPITNVQALVAAVAARAARLGGDGSLRSAAESLAASVVAAQREDGSWRYSEDGAADFVDSFHTGFVLEGLHGYLAAGGADDGVSRSLEAGHRYFTSHLVESSTGLPLARGDGRPTTDPQSVAQCAQTLAGSGRPGDLEAALATFRHFPTLDGDLLARPRGLHRARLLSLRWAVAPAALAAARLAAALRSATPARDG